MGSISVFLLFFTLFSCLLLFLCLYKETLFDCFFFFFFKLATWAPRWKYTLKYGLVLLVSAIWLAVWCHSLVHWFWQQTGQPSQRLVRHQVLTCLEVSFCWIFTAFIVPTANDQVVATDLLISLSLCCRVFFISYFKLRCFFFALKFKTYFEICKGFYCLLLGFILGSANMAVTLIPTLMNNLPKCILLFICFLEAEEQGWSKGRVQ